jgi:hypothetical protein
MNPAPVASTAAEINRLHAEAQRHAADSRTALTAALQCAWRAGQLLVSEKKRVRRTMGAGAWLTWLAANFRGSRRTAHRYMCLASTVSDPAFLRGLSIRQAYLRLGIATEPKSRAETVTVDMLPAYIRLAGRLLRALRAEARRKHPPGGSDLIRRDLADLYHQLRQLFEPANNSPARGSNRPCAPPDPKSACGA